MTRYRLSYLGGALLCAMVATGFASAGELAPQTRKNLDAAMHGEAYANLKYRAYAEAARKAGHEDLAQLFEQSADVEAKEHFAREANASGLAGFDAGNLADALAGEHYENTQMYTSFADEADKSGDKKVAKLFRQIAADEGDHYEQFKEAFLKLQSSPPLAGDKEKHGRND